MVDNRLKNGDNVYQRNFEEAGRRSIQKVRNMVTNIVEEQRSLKAMSKGSALSGAASALSGMSKISHESAVPTKRICRDKQVQASKTED